ncbi:hypothetical protein LCGC14_1392080 [marine sediment metagenome]|uniref:ATPase dynein-related AAA domain-containing protein n=1 Tax=marine sediment metagenome TaxID=412755 RepID=A0A0F9JZT0_9ZZZZ
MSTFAVTSTNRGAAKRLLSTWYDSKAIRVMTLAQLQDALANAAREMWITDLGVKAALNKQDKQRGKPAPAYGVQGAEQDEKDDMNPEPANVEQRDDIGEQAAQAQDERADADADADAEAKGQPQQSDEESGVYARAREKEEKEAAEQKQKEEEEEYRPLDEDEIVVHPMFETVCKYISAGLNVALVGPAGTGKSFLAAQVAKELSRKLFVNGALMSKYDLIGFIDAGGKYHETPAYVAFTTGGIHLFDEYDASSPEAIVAYNAMTDDQPFFTFPCGQVEKHASYTAICTLNTWGQGATADYVGRFKQDGAAMDRLVKVFIDYDIVLEKRLGPKDIVQRVHQLRAAVNELGIRHIVSTRKIIFASKARAKGVSKTEIDRDILFAGLDVETLKQVKAQMKQARS